MLAHGGTYFTRARQGSKRYTREERKKGRMSAVLSISATAVVRPTGAASRRSAARPAPLAPRAGLSMMRGASVVSLKAATVRSARRVVMVRASDEAEVETKVWRCRLTAG